MSQHTHTSNTMSDIKSEDISSEQAECAAVAVDKNENLLSIINICFENLFDWLSLDDLAALKLTCRQLYQMTGEFIQRKYPMRFAKVIGNAEQIRFLPRVKSVQHFGVNCRNIIIDPNFERLKYLATDHNQELESIAFWRGLFTEREVAIIPQVVKNVKIIEFFCTNFDSEFYECMLKYCTKMKHLVIKHKLNECKTTGVVNNWQLQNYPTLEHFYCDTFKLPKNLEGFFRLNPTLRSFQTNTGVFKETIEFLLKNYIKLDDMYRYVSDLDKLYERKQIKSLMIHSVQPIGNFRERNPRWTQLRCLDGICCEVLDNHSTEPIELLNLRLLILGPKQTLLSPGKAESLSQKLKNLEELYLRISSIDQIAPFIRNSAKLQKIYVYKAKNDLEGTQVHSLNKDRMKLDGACKVEVYLPDHAYVQMKWISKEMNCSLIEIKRTQSRIPNHPFVINTIRSFFIDERYGLYNIRH